MGDNPSIKKQAIWNLAAGLLGALESIIMTMAVNRYINIESSGEITIAFALGNLFRTIGLWGTRNFQVSDQNEEYSYSDYLKTRYLSITLMAGTVFIYILYSFFVQHISIHKLFVIVIIEIVFFIECYEDAIWGEYQRKGRIDIGAKLFLGRWGSFLISFLIMVFVLRKLIPALLVALFVSSLIFFYAVIHYHLGKTTKTDDNQRKILILSKKQTGLFLKTLPLFLITFFMFFLTNVAKYSLDQYYDLELQACFGFVTLPTFAVEMFSGFIYQPKLAQMSSAWLREERKDFFSDIIQQFLCILIITVLCVIVSWWLGAPVLSIIFATDLSKYRTDIVLNIIGGSAMSFSMYAGALLTIMRKQNLQLIIYSITAFIGGVFIWILVKYNGIRGGSLGTLIVFCIQAFIMNYAVFVVLFSTKIGDRKRKK